MVFALPTLTLSNLDPISSRRPINISCSYHADTTNRITQRQLSPPTTAAALAADHSGSSRRRLIHPWVLHRSQLRPSNVLF